MNKTCKNCQFWEREPLHKYETKEKQYIYGSCSHECFIYVWDFHKESEVDCLMYSDSEQFYASFKTGESFGCIHFKEKEI